MTLTTDGLQHAIKARQCEQPGGFGLAYKALYAVGERIRRDWYNLNDCVDMPQPILRFGLLPGARKAEYARHDTTFRCVITIDPEKFLNLADVVEWLAHEYAHLWMDWLEYEPEENAQHGDAFREAMANYGIAVEGKHGDHMGFIGDMWKTWLAKLNDELHLTSYLLTFQPKRTYLYRCPTCSRTLEHKRSDLVLTCHHEMSTETPGAFMSHLLH